MATDQSFQAKKEKLQSLDKIENVCTYLVVFNPTCGCTYDVNTLTTYVGK